MITKVKALVHYRDCTTAGSTDEIENPDSYYWYGYICAIDGEHLGRYTTNPEWHDAYVRGWEDATGSMELEESASK